jgi:hypothetical protein
MSGQDSAKNIIALPQGGGALQGLGEKFSADLHTGTGNFTVPISVPAGRNGFQPHLSLDYSSGQGNGPFGFGWALSIPCVKRQTSKGLPRYRDNPLVADDADTFVLSGSEDLVLVSPPGSNPAQYRPRTEGLFADIRHLVDGQGDFWEVRTKDGLTSRYGTVGMLGADPAVIADPSVAQQGHIFSWFLTSTIDPFGNRIEYDYERDTAVGVGNSWDQLYLKRIRYVDYVVDGLVSFLVSVTFDYENARSDSFSDYRAGFAIRTTRRCRTISVTTHAAQDRLVRTFDLTYLDGASMPLNGVSLLSQIVCTGHDGELTERLPPLEFEYSAFNPAARTFAPISGAALPANSLADPTLDLVDLFGQGLPDLLEMGPSTVRYWRNRGSGAFDLPQSMVTAPAGVSLSDPGVQLLDANGNGTADLVVTTPVSAGFYPLRFGGLWDSLGFRGYPVAPSVDLKAQDVKLLDLTGNGVTDAIRGGATLQCFFNDPVKGWRDTRTVTPSAGFPGDFTNARVKWGDMNGDQLTDILTVNSGSVQYWPNLGYGNWGDMVTMANNPTFPFGYDPARLLVADVDGDGLADIGVPQQAA